MAWTINRQERREGRYANRDNARFARLFKKDYSEKNQLKQIDMLRMMLKINQDVVIHGISKLEDYENSTTNFPMLCKGLKLVRGRDGATGH